ncbi:MAG TPA: energy transducer TonB [Planctomycetota bacterium]|nr:energy transducer TonB [Planctomycetota bacterium]
MKGFALLVSRLNGWALSLILHGLVGALAALSVFGVASSGGSGAGHGGGAAGGGGAADSHEATVHSDELVSGELVGDPAQYGRVSDDVAPDASSEELPAPVLPFDVFAVGASDVPPPPTPPSLADPLTSRSPAADRGTKLPAGDNGNDGPGTEKDGPAGSAESAGDGGRGGSGGGNTGGEGHGSGSGVGDGAATELYTPAPAYPSDARRQNIQGIVLVEILIASDGTCAVQRVVESSGCSSLDHAVTATVSRWKYQPAAADHRPDLTTKRVRFVFKLGERDKS